MTETIDLNRERAKREQPDADCVRKDHYGRPMFLYSLEYRFQDKTWCVNLWAYSFDDAEGRAAAMRESLTLSGQIHSIIPA